MLNDAAFPSRLLGSVFRGEEDSLVLADLHDSIQRLLYEKGRILPQDVDVRFETPTREWIGSLVRPTVDFFLYEVRENTEIVHRILTQA